MTNERYVRWQKYAIDQLTFSLNLFLGLSVGSLSFVITLLRDDYFTLSSCSKIAFLISLIALVLAVIAGCIAVIVRLHDFRYTARKIRADEKYELEEAAVYKFRSKVLGQLTWRLLYFELLTFAIGIAGLIVTLFTKYGQKLW